MKTRLFSVNVCLSTGVHIPINSNIYILYKAPQMILVGIKLLETLFLFNIFYPISIIMVNMIQDSFVIACTQNNKDKIL